MHLLYRNSDEQSLSTDTSAHRFSPPSLKKGCQSRSQQKLILLHLQSSSCQSANDRPDLMHPPTSSSWDPQLLIPKDLHYLLFTQNPSFINPTATPTLADTLYHLRPPSQLNNPAVPQSFIAPRRALRSSASGDDRPGHRVSGPDDPFTPADGLQGGSPLGLDHEVRPLLVCKTRS